MGRDHFLTFASPRTNGFMYLLIGFLCADPAAVPRAQGPGRRLAVPVPVRPPPFPRPSRSGLAGRRVRVPSRRLSASHDWTEPPALQSSLCEQTVECPTDAQFALSPLADAHACAHVSSGLRPYCVLLVPRV